MEDFALSNAAKDERAQFKLEILLEAARRATWDALHGPRHLRAGRFHPFVGLPITANLGRPAKDQEGAGPSGAAMDKASPRR